MWGTRTIAPIWRLRTVVSKKAGSVLFTPSAATPIQRLADQFTNKYIFPNGMLPSIPQLGSAMAGLFVMEDWHNIGPDYDPTLMAWQHNFEAAWPELKKNYSERFRRMWNYYLLRQRWQFPVTQSAIVADRIYPSRHNPTGLSKGVTMHQKGCCDRGRWPCRLGLRQTAAELWTGLLDPG